MKSKSHIEFIRNLTIYCTDVDTGSWTRTSKPKSFGRERIKSEITEHPIDNDLCFVLQRANRVVSRRADAALRAAGLTAEQTLLLAAIAEAASPRAADLSRALGIEASTIAANLKPLMKQSWTFALVDVDDRRARRLFLTEAGSERLQMAVRHLQEFEDVLSIQIGGKRNVRTVCHTLSTLTTACL
ncbi:winged helix-turn-helix transcriptional regulator (plasmid) [Rhizobium sp. 007]|nr:winged helix-turn-helix transcriptional regulator [Rhizobium sp. 007]